MAKIDSNYLAIIATCARSTDTINRIHGNTQERNLHDSTTMRRLECARETDAVIHIYSDTHERNSRDPTTMPRFEYARKADAVTHIYSNAQEHQLARFSDYSEAGMRAGG
jgi:hypothetical protein